MPGARDGLRVAGDGGGRPAAGGRGQGFGPDFRKEFTRTAGHGPARETVNRL
jgi:hypothetical protein